MTRIGPMSLKAATRIGLALATTLMLTGCASSGAVYHNQFMRGSIVDASSDSVVVCIGSENGATVGQELDVYRLHVTRTRPAPKYHRYREGAVRIVEVIDDHFARAEIIEGEAKENWIVELDRQSKERP